MIEREPVNGASERANGRTSECVNERTAQDTLSHSGFVFFFAQRKNTSKVIEYVRELLHYKLPQNSLHNSLFIRHNVFIK